MTSQLFIQYLFAGITYGSIYAIVAIGFNIIYNTTGIINFAQGEFVMLGGMIAISLHAMLPLPLAIGLAVIITMIIGALIEIIFIRWLKNPSVLRMIIITIGLSILIREGALHIWGEGVRSLPYFNGNEISTLRIMGTNISPQVLWVIGSCSVIVALLSLFFKFTSLGQEMRACAANRLAATLCGISTKNMVTFSFMLSAGIGALAGCVVSPITYTQYDGGTPLAIKGFTVAVLGGLGNSMAAVIAGLLLGIIEAFSVSVVPLAFQDA
ncbi:MAG: branched-chain amino acid ABC transporter permease, partial [Proteobacteria bacterium]|nr:branched-chain amino acid ABC transporter permease [Pseudomonadota bacterium]